MIFNLLTKIHAHTPFESVSAHCDIPCKIYDPISAQLAVLTMLRMVNLLEELTVNQSLSYEQQVTYNRLLNEKENHGKKVKQEVSIIWGDYFKQPHLDKYPILHALTHNIMLKASVAKQQVNRQATEELLTLVNRFAEIFWQSKNVATFEAICPYPPAERLVYPDLNSK